MIVSLKLSQPHGITPTANATCVLVDGTSVEVATAVSPYEPLPDEPLWIHLNVLAATPIPDPYRDIVTVAEIAVCEEPEEEV